MKQSFWDGKKVMVTGHTGFKGSWLSLYLLALGAKVIGYSLPPPTHPSLFQIAHLDQDMPSYLEDIRDFDSLHQTVKTEQPDIVLHLAAQSLVRYSYEHPVETYATNVMGTVNLLEALRLSDCTRVVIIVTSDKCYENKEWLWGYREIDPLGGYDPYSSSKGCAELITAAYRNSFFNQANPALLLASARAGNVIGGGDWAKDRLIPDFLRAVDSKQPIVIRNPTAIRPWQHVLEPVSGYLLLAEKLWQQDQDFAGGWNFGPSDEDNKSVAWIIDQLARLWNESVEIKITGENHPHEAQALKLDTSKAKIKLPWRPRWGIEKALQQTIEWHRAFRQNQNMRDFTLQQIEAYQSKGL